MRLFETVQRYGAIVSHRINHNKAIVGDLMVNVKDLIANGEHLRLIITVEIYVKSKKDCYYKVLMHQED